MKLQPGITLKVLSHFRSTLFDAGLLTVNSGTERNDDHFSPQHDWRNPSAEELALLLPGTSDPAGGHETIALFEIPNHLRLKWWAAADELIGADGERLPAPSPLYQLFLTALTDFLRFKRVDIAPSSKFETLVTAPGRTSTRLAAESSKTAGLGTDPHETSLVINLGDEPTSLVFLNLPLGKISDMADSHESPAGEDMVRAFLSRYPDYPLVRVTLNPGAGYRLRSDRIAHDGYTIGKNEPDIVLRIIPSAGCGNEPQKQFVAANSG